MLTRDSKTGRARGQKERLQIWFSGLVGLFFGASFLWGLFLYGAAEIQTSYRLFLLLLVPVLIALWGLCLGNHQTRFLLVLAIGFFLLLQIFQQETLAGRGYVILALGWMALFLTLTLTSESVTASRNIAIFLILVGSIEALYGLVQSLGGIDYIGHYYRGLGSQASGTLINRNHFAGLLNMTIPVAVGALFAGFSFRRSKVRLHSEVYAWVWILLLSCSLMGLAVLLSRSRGGAVILLGSLILVALMLSSKKRKHRSESLSSVAVWILIITSLGLSSWVGLDALLRRFDTLDIDMSTRTAIYRASLPLIGENYWAGVGPGMYRWMFRPYQVERTDTLYTHAHNDYLQSAAEWGIPAALVFWGFVLWRLRQAARTFFQSKDRWRQGIALGCVGAIFSILLHSFIDFNLQIPSNWMIFNIVLGLSWSVEEDANLSN